MDVHKTNTTRINTFRNSCILNVAPQLRANRVFNLAGEAIVLEFLNSNWQKYLQKRAITVCIWTCLGCCRLKLKLNGGLENLSIRELHCFTTDSIMSNMFQWIKQKLQKTFYKLLTFMFRLQVFSALSLSFHILPEAQLHLSIKPSHLTSSGCLIPFSKHIRHKAGI